MSEHIRSLELLEKQRHENMINLLGILREMTGKEAVTVPTKRLKQNSERDIKSILKNMAFQAVQTVIREASSQGIYFTSYI